MDEEEKAVATLFAGVIKIQMEGEHKSYERRKIGRDEVGGLVVSTCLVEDLCLYETALCDCVAAHPVERYGLSSNAEEGHARWVRWTADRANTTVTKLGYMDFIKPEEIVLQRETEH